MDDKYQDGKIYKIVSHSRPELVYYGSTINTLRQRMSQHKGAKNPCTSKQIIDCGDAIILLLELYPCNSRDELTARELQFILNNPCVNKYKKTKKEPVQKSNKLKEDVKIENDPASIRLQQIKDQTNARSKKYYEKHKAEIAERRKERRLEVNQIVEEAKHCQ